ncbi:hypothetical protein [Streptomyces naphthomycinicus]|nr:hypothetical protein [Streptomyces sp. TML10]
MHEDVLRGGGGAPQDDDSFPGREVMRGIGTGDERATDATDVRK